MTAGRRATILLQAAAALAALGCVAAIFPTLAAEYAYGRARGYGVAPSEDRPGRLEAYAIAAGREPGDFIYPFRSGQILLERGSVEDAAGKLERAAALQPLDARIRATLADAYLRLGRIEDAALESERSVRLGPRHPKVLHQAVSLRTRLWLSLRDPVHLRAAIVAARIATHVGAEDPAHRMARALGRRGGNAVPDLVEATDGDAELFAFAARYVAGARPDLGPVLTAELERMGGTR